MLVSGVPCLTKAACSCAVTGGRAGSLLILRLSWLGDMANTTLSLAMQSDFSQYPPFNCGDSAFLHRQTRAEEAAQRAATVGGLRPCCCGVRSLLIAALRVGRGSIGSRARRPPIEFLPYPMTVALCRVPPGSLFWPLPSWPQPSSLLYPPPFSVQPNGSLAPYSLTSAHAQNEGAASFL